MRTNSVIKPLGPVELWYDANLMGKHERFHERLLQVAFGDWMAEEHPHIAFEREVRITPGLRPDFVGSFNVGGISFLTAYELKWRADMASVHQLASYVEALEPMANGAIVSGVLVAEEFYLGDKRLPPWIALLQVHLNFYRSKQWA